MCYEWGVKNWDKVEPPPPVFSPFSLLVTTHVFTSFCLILFHPYPCQLESLITGNRR